MHLPDSVLFVPAIRDAERWLNLCAEYAQQHGYHIVAVVHEWSSAWAMIASGKTSIIVVGRRDHVPSDREPRMEVIAEQGAIEKAVSDRRPQRRR